MIKFNARISTFNLSLSLSLFCVSRFSYFWEKKFMSLISRESFSLWFTYIANKEEYKDRIYGMSLHSSLTAISFWLHIAKSQHLMRRKVERSFNCFLFWGFIIDYQIVFFLSFHLIPTGKPYKWSISKESTESEWGIQSSYSFDNNLTDDANFFLLDWMSITLNRSCDVRFVILFIWHICKYRCCNFCCLFSK